jgi:hypothetical protein
LAKEVCRVNAVDDHQNNQRLGAGLVIRFKVILAAQGEYLTALGVATQLVQ